MGDANSPTVGKGESFRQRWRGRMTSLVQRASASSSPVVPVLLALVTGYRFGVRVTKNAVAPAGAKARPPILMTTLLALFIVKEIWSAIPNWVRRQIPFVGRKYREAPETIREDDLSSLSALRSKLTSLYNIMSEKLQDYSTENVQIASLVLLKLQAQFRQANGKLRDQRYQEAGKVIPASEYQKVMNGLDEAFELADFAYNEIEDEKSLKDALTERGYYLVRHDPIALPGTVAHYVAIHKEKRECIVGIKGTSGFEDMLTDMCGQSVSFDLEAPYMEGKNATVQCHEGIIISSKQLANDLEPLINELILPNKYSLLLTGHSLGAGSAALTAIILKSRIDALRKDKDGKILKVLAFASPPVLNYEAALASSSFCTTIVNDSDIIPRASLSNLINTMALVKKIGERLKDRGVDPKDWSSTLKFLDMLTNDDMSSIMSSEEINDELEEIANKQVLDEPDHLYVPGKVIHMYQEWSTSTEATKNDSDESDEAKADEAKSGIRRVYVGDGTSKVLRYIENDPNMLEDHMAPPYRKNIRALLDLAGTPEMVSGQ